MRRHKRPIDAPEVGQHHGGSFHVYMAHKKAKLRNKFDEIAALSSSSENYTSKIFDDVVVYINGYTQPSFDELKLLLGQHGGVVEHYLSKTTCTHIVAANLPDTKVKEMLNEKKPLPAVLPNWIIDSISAGKRLPESDYLLPQFRNRGRASRNVAAFFHADRVPSTNLDLEQTSAASQQIQNVTNKPSTDLDTLPAIDMHRSHGFSDEAYKNMRSSLTDTDFVRSYFRSSRLHLIGSWREFVQSIVRTAQRIPRETPRQMDGERTIVHIDLDCFFVQVSLLKQPQELWRVPIAISHSSIGPKHKTTDITDTDSKQRQFNTGHAQRTDMSNGGSPSSSKKPNATTSGFSAAEISSANYFARIYGVKASMFVGYAQHLCPELTVLPYDFDGIKRVSSNVYRTLTSYFSGLTFGHLFSLTSTELGTSSFGSQQNYRGLPQYLSEVRDALQNYENWKEVINTIEATSCDEAYLDISGCKDPSSFVQHLRAAIYAATGCTCSAGIGPNKLLARLATRDAKQSKIDAAKYLQREKPLQDPTSQSQTFDISAHQEIQSVQHSEHIMFSPVSREGVVLIPNNQAHVAAKLRNLPVERMPGIGWKTKNVLSDNGINTVADALEIPKPRLETILGKQTGKLLYNAIRGIDLEQGLQELGDRKSVGADINWGVRFQKQDDALHFIRQLCCEVFTRLRRAAFLDTGKDVPNDIFFQHLATSNDINGDPVNLVGEPYFVVSAVLLRVKKRQPGAPPPGKPLGCGACDNFSKSAQLNRGLTSNDLHRFISITIELYKALNLEVTEIRGVGIQLSKLRLFDASGQLMTMSSIESEEGSSYNIQNMWERMKSVNRQQRSPTNSQIVSSETDAPRTFDRRQRDPMTSTTSNIAGPKTNTRTNSQNDFFLDIPATEIDPSVWSSLPGNVRQEIRTSIQANRRPGMLDHFQLSQPSPMGRTDRGLSKTHVPAKSIKNTSKRAHSMGAQTSLEDYRLLYEFRRRVIENGHANDDQASSSDVITLSTQQDTSPPQTYEGDEYVRSYRQYSPTSSPLLSQTQRKGRLLSQQLSGKREHNTLSHNIRSSVKHPPMICLELDSSSDSEQTPSKTHSRSSGSDQTPSKTHSRSSDVPHQRAEAQNTTTRQVNDLIGASSSDVDPEWFAALPAKVQIQVVRDIHKKYQQTRSFFQDVPSGVTQTHKHDLKPQDQPVTDRQYIPELHGMMSPTNSNMVCFLREMPALDLPMDQPKLLEDFAATVREWSIAIQQCESIKDRSVSETRCMLFILQLLADWRTDDIHMCLRYLQRMRNQYSHMSTLFQRVEMFARSTCQDYLGFRLDIS